MVIKDALKAYRCNLTYSYMDDTNREITIKQVQVGFDTMDELVGNLDCTMGKLTRFYICTAE